MEHLLDGVRVLDLTRGVGRPVRVHGVGRFGRGSDQGRATGYGRRGAGVWAVSKRRERVLCQRQPRQEERDDRLAAGSGSGLGAAFGRRVRRVDRELSSRQYGPALGWGTRTCTRCIRAWCTRRFRVLARPARTRSGPRTTYSFRRWEGLASITGQPDGPPVRVGSSIADLSAALFGAIGILAALERARRTGEGQQIDISMLDCQVALLENALARYAVSDEVPRPLGSRHPAITPFQFFAARDGYIVIAAGNDRLWRQLCEALDLGALADDPRFASNALRTENHAALEPVLEQVLAEKTVDEWGALY